MIGDFLDSYAFWGVLVTAGAYGLGAWINRKTGKAFFNPLLLASIFLIAFLSAAGIPCADYQASSEPVQFLLMPATVSLAIPLYEKWELLRKNARAILAGILSGAVASLLGIWLLSKVLGLSQAQYVTLLPKSVTTAIGMDVSAELGGMASLTGAVIILTGIAGNLLAQLVFRLFHIRAPIARGVALGTSAHAIGTTKALELGEVEGAMSSLSIAVAGLLTAFLAPLCAQWLHM